MKKQKAVEIFERTVKERSGVEAPDGVTFEVSPAVPAEGFAIEDGPDGGILIKGGDERGLLYGAGKLLRTSRFDEGAFRPGLDASGASLVVHRMLEAGTELAAGTGDLAEAADLVAGMVIGSLARTG